MNENNEFLLEGLDNADNKKKNIIQEEEDENVDENENEEKEQSMFIHENDALQKSFIINRKTLIFPKSKLSTEENYNMNINNVQNKANEDKDIDNNEDYLQVLDNEESANRYLNAEEMLNFEDPFMRVSRPSALYNNYSRFSAMNFQIPKRNKKVFFNERTPIFKHAKSKNDINKITKGEEMKEKIRDNTEAPKNIILEEEEENFEEKEEKNKNKYKKLESYIGVYRPSFISRVSIDFEEDYLFEVEVVDSVVMTILNVINCMIKANLVQIATSMKSLGLIMGPITICIIALMSLISLNLILEANKMTGITSYLIFSERIFGHYGSIIILICQFMSAFGGCLSFIVMYNKVVPTLFNFSLSNSYLSDNNNTFFSATLALILFFYCYKQDINVIKAAAKYAVFSILLFFFLTILDFIVAVFSQDRLININN